MKDNSAQGAMAYLGKKVRVFRRGDETSAAKCNDLDVIIEVKDVILLKEESYILVSPNGLNVCVVATTEVSVVA